MDESRGAAAAVPRVGGKGADPLLGRVINDRYKVVSIVARGGMGKVYRAEQAPLGRLVALKVLDPAHSGEDDPEFHQRFFLEASLTSKLTHPNTVTVFDYGKTDDDVYYIAMELLEGRTLHRALRDDGPFGAERTIHIVAQIARGLRDAHSRGVVHRDLKPANVFLVQHEDENDFVKVLDFGLVKNVKDKADDQLTKTGVFLGSPKYMAPEQIRGEAVDGRCDVYALGILTFEMLTGKAPFEKPTSVNTLMAHLHEDIPSLREFHPSAHAPELEGVLRRCLAKDPAHRYASMNDLLIALKEIKGISSRAGEFGLNQTGEYTPPPRDHVLASIANANISGGHSALSQPQSVSQKGAAPFAQASKSNGNGAPLFLAAVFALTGIAGFIVLSGQFQNSGQQSSAQSAEAARAAEAAQASAVEAAAPAPNRAVLISLRSTPPGATVIIDEKEYGPTPTHALLSGASASLGREVVFVFRRRGYRELTLVRKLDGTRLDVDAGRMEQVTGRRSAVQLDTEQPPQAAAPAPTKLSATP